MGMRERWVSLTLLLILYDLGKLLNLFLSQLSIYNLKTGTSEGFPYAYGGGLYWLPSTLLNELVQASELSSASLSLSLSCDNDILELNKI